jgi:hypothetical protein
MKSWRLTSKRDGEIALNETAVQGCQLLWWLVSATTNQREDSGIACNARALQAVETNRRGWILGLKPLSKSVEAGPSLSL